jgi:uncharacterized protein (DUF736 family)
MLNLSDTPKSPSFRRAPTISIWRIVAKDGCASIAYDATAATNFFPLAAEESGRHSSRPRSKKFVAAVLRSAPGLRLRRRSPSPFARHRDRMGRSEKMTERTMATIGNFTKSGDGFAGTVSTLTLDAKVQIKPAEKTSEKAPDFRLYSGAVELGAAWLKTSAEKRSYLSVRLDDPSLPGPILANLCEMENGAYDLIWSRPNRHRTRD